MCSFIGGSTLPRMRARLVTGLATLAALTVIGGALAAVENRISLKATGGNDLEHYSPALAIVAVAPPEYKRGCCYDSSGGEWVGPRYEATDRATLGANSTYNWNVGVAVRAGGTRKALLANLTHDFPVVSEGKQLIEHRVNGRVVGKVAGYWVLTRSTFAGENDAQMEAAVGFSLCDGNTAYAQFSLLRPSGDSAGGDMGYGEYLIRGMPPTVWNAEKGMQAIRGIRFEGNRPTTRITAVARGGRVAGRVADCDGHPLAKLAVQLQQRTGSTWRTVASARTAATGAYSFAAPSAGTYRVRAEARASRPVRIS